VVEVVSENRREDYVIKRGEYELANVPEYCLVDPKTGKQKIRLFSLIEGEEGYTYTDFLPGEEMESVVFPNLRLSVNEILDPPLVEGLIKAEQAQLQQLETVEQRAERLAARLRELGVDPDAV
jgi:hypothetical protein